MKRARNPALVDCPVAACPHRMVAWAACCDACWRRLPQHLRAPIEAARRSGAKHLEGAASIEAVAWLNRAPAAIAAQRLGETFQAEVG